MRRSDVFFLILFLCVVLLTASMLDARQKVISSEGTQAMNALIVKKLGLTDLCLFNDARYTRHLSQADFHSAFQDHPAALDHFPSGSFANPPAYLRPSYDSMD